MGRGAQYRSGRRPTFKNQMSLSEQRLAKFILTLPILVTLLLFSFSIVTSLMKPNLHSPHEGVVLKHVMYYKLLRNLIILGLVYI
jgi:hypothetical protein